MQETETYRKTMIMQFHGSPIKSLKIRWAMHLQCYFMLGSASRRVILRTRVGKASPHCEMGDFLCISHQLSHFRGKEMITSNYIHFKFDTESKTEYSVLS